MLGVRVPLRVSTDVRYIIHRWLWASCRLPPIKTPRAPQHRSANSQPDPDQNRADRTPSTPFSHIFIRAEIARLQLCRH